MGDLRPRQDWQSLIVVRFSLHGFGFRVQGFRLSVCALRV